MTARKDVGFFSTPGKLAIVGVSHKKKKFGYYVCKQLTAKGYELSIVHPDVDKIDDIPCFSSVKDLPGDIDTLLIIVPPTETEKLVKDAADAGIKHVWMQEGAASEEAVRFCRENGMTVVHDECILMFAEPVTSFHKFHRWIWKLLGKLPE